MIRHALTPAGITAIALALALASLFIFTPAQAQDGATQLAGPSHGLAASGRELSGLPTLQDPDFSYFQARSFLIRLCVSLADVQGALDSMEPGRYRAAPFPPCGDDGTATLVALDAAVDRVFDFGDGAAIVGPTARLLVLGVGVDTKGTEDVGDDGKGLLQLAVYTPTPGPINRALGVSDMAHPAAISWQIGSDSALATNQATYNVEGDDGFAVRMRLDWPLDAADARAPVSIKARAGTGSPRIYFAGNRMGGQHPSIEFEFIRNGLDIGPGDFTIEVSPADRIGLAAGDISILKILNASVSHNQEMLIKVFPDDAP
jgi:hypothetical protein